MPLRWFVTQLPDLLCDPAIESERFRRDLKTHLFAGHFRVMSALEVSSFHGIMLYKLTFTYVLRCLVFP